MLHSGASWKKFVKCPPASMQGLGHRYTCPRMFVFANACSSNSPLIVPPTHPLQLSLVGGISLFEHPIAVRLDIDLPTSSGLHLAQWSRYDGLLRAEAFKLRWTCATGHDACLPGNKVEMRRWFTWIDGAKQLDRFWNVALLAMCASFLLDGQERSDFT